MHGARWTTSLAVALAAAASLVGWAAQSQPIDNPEYLFGPFIGPPGFPGAPSTVFGVQTLTLTTVDQRTFVLPATDTGAYWTSNDGFGPPKYGYHFAENKNYTAATCSNYGCSTLLGPEENARDYFVFDLGGVSGQIVSATLSIGNGPNGSDGSATGPIHFQLWDVSTPVADLEATQHVGLYALSIYNDLGAGALFGGADVFPSQNGAQIEIALFPWALDSLTAAEGGSWAIGGSVVPEPESWMIMLTGFGLVGGGMRRARRIA